MKTTRLSLSELRSVKERIVFRGETAESWLELVRAYSRGERIDPIEAVPYLGGEAAST